MLLQLMHYAPKYDCIFAKYELHGVVNFILLLFLVKQCLKHFEWSSTLGIYYLVILAFLFDDTNE